MELSDGQVVHLYQLGQHSLFSEITKRYEAYIYAQCFSYVRDKEAAKDLTQEVLIKIFLHLPRFRKEAGLKTWIYAIAYHTCIDYLRKSKKSAFDAISEKLIEQLPEMLEESDDFQGEKDIHLLEQLLSQMTHEGRLILLMKYVEKQSIKDIQRVLGVSESAIKMRLKRARTVLQKLYLKQYGEV